MFSSFLNEHPMQNPKAVARECLLRVGHAWLSSETKNIKIRNVHRVVENSANPPHWLATRPLIICDGETSCRHKSQGLFACAVWYDRQKCRLSGCLHTHGCCLQSSRYRKKEKKKTHHMTRRLLLVYFLAPISSIKSTTFLEYLSCFPCLISLFQTRNVN